MKTIRYSRIIEKPRLGLSAGVILAEDHHTNRALVAGTAVSTSAVQSIEVGGVFTTLNTRYEPADGAAQSLNL